MHVICINYTYTSQEVDMQLSLKIYRNRTSITRMKICTGIYRSPTRLQANAQSRKL